VRRLLFFILPVFVLLTAAGTAVALAPHGDWPTQTGPQIMHHNDEETPMHGTPRNDRLLGGHGDDHIYGQEGHDVIWGDYKPTGNTTTQVDYLYGGPGKDWIYASHGRNVVYGGPGGDTIRVWFGRGKVYCGPGRDILFLSKHRSRNRVKRYGCERISFKSARQVDEDGGPRVP
jgi:Ca2+-binding RTX toxin-like protein